MKRQIFLLTSLSLLALAVGGHGAEDVSWGQVKAGLEISNEAWGPAAKKTVPFTASFSLVGINPPNPGNPIPDPTCFSSYGLDFPLLFTFQGPGNGTHLGASIVTTNHCGILGPGIESTEFQDGQLVFKAANGDKVHGTFTGQATNIIWPFSAVLGGDFVITGGTGRFAKASGGGTFKGTFDILAFTGSATFEGRISSVGSNKK